MPRKKKTEEVEETPLARLFELIDEQVDKRHKATLAVRDTTAEIARLASEARRKSATMPELVSHVKRTDKDSFKLVSVSRQALDTMLAVHEKRREPRTTRASRRSRSAEAPAGQLNTEAFG